MSNDTVISIRVNSDELTEFKKQCEQLGKPYTNVMREFITASNQCRLKISLTEAQFKKQKELYQ
jgi:predicted DNA binding CopG/RHH family protein